MAAADVAQGSNQALKAQIQTFLTDDRNEKYQGLLKYTADNLSTRFLISMDDLRNADPDLARRLVRNPIETVLVFEAAVKESLLDIEPNFFTRLWSKKNQFHRAGDQRQERIHVGFEGHIGEGQQVTPRTLGARHMSTMVAVHGIVTKVSVVRPKVVRSVHYCPTTDKFESRDYRDDMDLSGQLPTGSVYPTKDEEGNALETEFGLSIYKDSQTVTIQEMPESAPLGQLPRSVDIALEKDLVDTCKPGDRIAVYGIYRARTGVNAGAKTFGTFRTVLIANNVRKLGKTASNLVLTDTDVANIEAYAQNKSTTGEGTLQAFDLLGRSLAPAIYGHKFIKRSLALLLAGGVEHNLENGTHIRGDINLLMVGDPSTAKSQLLRFVLNIAPIAVNTTGRGSSGVGLTAAVTTDPETGDRRLEAGAMVLADRGVVCIDEFDKMSDADRVAIHEVMEQQTVTIAKAGIQASLNARCSVVAAANPVYGRFDPNLPLVKNVALPDSLLSRFDLLFIVRDHQDKAQDLRLADHIIRMHRYYRPGQEGVPVPLDATAQGNNVEEERDSDGTSPVYIKFNQLLHGGVANEMQAAAGADGLKLLNLEFIRKYFHYVKAKVSPRLTTKARRKIVREYDNFRQNSAGRAVIITARSLETIIRLSSAHAKLRLSPIVQPSDVEQAVRIMRYALYGDERGPQRPSEEGLAAPRGPGGAPGDGPGGRQPRTPPKGGEDEDADDDGDEGRPRGGKKARSPSDRSSAGKRRAVEGEGDEWAYSSPGQAPPASRGVKKAKTQAWEGEEEEMQVDGEPPGLAPESVPMASAQSQSQSQGVGGGQEDSAQTSSLSLELQALANAGAAADEEDEDEEEAGRDLVSLYFAWKSSDSPVLELEGGSVEGREVLKAVYAWRQSIKGKAEAVTALEDFLAYIRDHVPSSSTIRAKLQAVEAGSGSGGKRDPLVDTPWALSMLAALEAGDYIMVTPEGFVHDI